MATMKSPEKVNRRNQRRKRLQARAIHYGNVNDAYRKDPEFLERRLKWRKNPWTIEGEKVELLTEVFDVAIRHYCQKIRDQFTLGEKKILTIENKQGKVRQYECTMLPNLRFVCWEIKEKANEA